MANLLGVVHQMKRATNEEGFWEEINTFLPNDGGYHKDYLTTDFSLSFVCNLHDAVASPGWRQFHPQEPTPTIDLVKRYSEAHA